MSWWHDINEYILWQIYLLRHSRQLWRIKKAKVNWSVYLSQNALLSPQEFFRKFGHLKEVFKNLSGSASSYFNLCIQYTRQEDIQTSQPLYGAGWQCVNWDWHITQSFCCYSWLVFDVHVLPLLWLFGTENK